MPFRLGETGWVRPGEWLIGSLDLAPHPEGGWYRRTWVAPAGEGERPAGSVVYYLLLDGEVSAPHRIDATELWHFYAGDRSSSPWRAPVPRRVRGSSGLTLRPASCPGRRRPGCLAVGPVTRPVHARGGDRDAGVPLRGIRAPSGPCGWVMIRGRATEPHIPQRRPQWARPERKGCRPCSTRRGRSPRRGSRQGGQRPARHLRRGRGRPAGVLGGAGDAAHLGHPLDGRPGVEPPVCQVVRWCQAQRGGQLRRPPR